VFPLAEKWVILPHSLIDEVKGLKEEQASSTKFVKQLMLGQYISIFSGMEREGIEAIRNQLTRNIARVLSDLQDEAAYCLEQTVGDAPTWNAMHLYGSILKIISSLSARTFVGMPLCRDEEWLSSTINITTDAMNSIYALRQYRPWMRPFVAPFLSQLRKMDEYQKFFSRKVNPQVKAIVNAYKQNGTFTRKPSAADIDDDDITDDNNSLVHWTIQNYKDPSKITVAGIANVEIVTAFAAIHTTSMALTNVLLDLAAHPQYVVELREEFETVVAEENCPDKLLRKTSMPKLKKLDSFIKESQRMNPPSVSMFGIHHVDTMQS
jgi:hypothetical protein